MPILNGKKVTPFPGIKIKSVDALRDAVIQFDNATAAPTTTSGYYYLYASGGELYWNNGAGAVQISTSGGSDTPSFETLYNADSNMALTTAAWTISQAGNFGNLILTKAGSGAGVPLVINNAGTGNDFNIVNTNAEAAGVVISTDAQSASAADADVPFALLVNGYSDVGTAREYGQLKFVADDTGDGSEDCSITFNAMTAGTSRKILGMTAALCMIGYGAAAVITSQGAYDLKLETNSGTN